MVGLPRRYRDGMPVVEFRGVVALLGRFPALTGLDLTVKSGETVLLQGPNGSGKSTLLRLCSGLVRPTRGEARVLDCDLTIERQSVRRRVALLSHAGGLYDDLTVMENVAFWAQAAGLGSVAASDRVEWALHRLGLSGSLANQLVRTISAGQRRRTSLAALAVRRPDLWLLDEPHAGLDQQGRGVVDSLIREAVAAGGTVVVSSHELERTRGLSSRVVTLAGGTVVDDQPGVDHDA